MCKYMNFYRIYKYFPTIRTSWKYLPDKKGLIVGLIVGGFGLSASILTFIIKAMVNPDNIQTDKTGFYPDEVINNLKSYYLFLILFFGGLSILAIFLMQPINDANFIADSAKEKEISNDDESAFTNALIDKINKEETSKAKENEKVVVVITDDIEDVYDSNEEKEEKKEEIIENQKRSESFVTVKTVKKVVKLRKAIFSKQNYFLFAIGLCCYCKLILIYFKRFSCYYFKYL